MRGADRNPLVKVGSLRPHMGLARRLPRLPPPRGEPMIAPGLAGRAHTSNQASILT